MADDSKITGRLGDSVNVQIRAGGKRRRPPRRVDDRRYGPPPFLGEDELIAKRGSAVVTFLDMSSVFIIHNVGTTGRHVLFYTQLHANTPLETKAFLWTRTQLESSVDRATLGNASLDPTEIDVADAVNGTYRQTFSRWPLPRLHTANFGLSFHLNALDLALSDAEALWLERVISGAVEIAEQSADWSLSDSTDTDSTGNLWHGWSTTFRDEWWKNYAQFKKKPSARRSTWRVDSSASIPCFEAFDPWDTENFKVTQGAYADAEVAAPKIDVSRGGVAALQIGLVPRFWAISGSFSEWAYWYDGVTSPNLYKRSGSFSDEVLGITCPYVSGFDILHDASNPDNVGVALINQVEYSVGTLSPVSGMFNDGAGHAPSSATFTADIDGVPPQQTAFAAGSPAYSNTHTNFLMYMLAQIFIARGDLHTSFSGDYPFDPYPLHSVVERSDATIDVAVAETPIGALVGRFRYKGALYNVYRKTANSGGASVYSGGFDSLGFGSGWADGHYINSFFNSFARDFTDYDPLGLVGHVTI